MLYLNANMYRNTSRPQKNARYQCWSRRTAGSPTAITHYSRFRKMIDQPNLQGIMVHPFIFRGCFFSPSSFPTNWFFLYIGMPGALQVARRQNAAGKRSRIFWCFLLHVLHPERFWFTTIKQSFEVELLCNHMKPCLVKIMWQSSWSLYF